VGKVTVPPESTLVIEPGVVVDFQGHYKLQVDSAATLLAVGTESDSIYFTTDDTATGWHGIRFMGASSNSQLSYCRLEYGKAVGRWPHPDAGGGAVCCYYSSPEITNNAIRDNWASHGGGIACLYDSNPTISANIISGNFAEGYGGGIYCGNSAPLIIGNGISGNLAGGGAGVGCLEHSSPTISGNNISSNSTDGYGGGIYCRNSEPLLIDNTIGGNLAYYGGGICCYDWSDPTISNNSISGNSASYRGGGISCYYSSPTITNTILWADTAPECQEISEGGNPTVTYCDVQGGWPGLGNIDADPLFAGPEREDFHLRWHSPCIDAGYPDSLDPDGTRSDIGAFYFNQAVPGIVELYPRNTPIVIPPEGGDIVYDGWVFNFVSHSRRADIWTFAFIPGIGRYGPIDLYRNVRIPADSLGMNEIVQHVPGAAPEGDYVFAAYVGSYPSNIIDSSYFYFSKGGSVASGVMSWFDCKGWFKGVNLEESNLPSDYSLSQNHPNPFNATTIINYVFPLDSYVKLEVYNTLGQKVATLVDSRQQAGYKSVVWDASAVSSGIYFYRLVAGDYTENKRMMLVK
jgi:hypothetical protein